MSTVVLVTGASRGIGKGFVQHYLQRPSTTVIAAVRSPSSVEAASLLEFECAPGSSVILVKIEAKSATDATEAARELREHHGIDRIDIVIANAGVFYPSATQRIADMDLADLQEHIEVNAYGVIRLFQATWPLLEKSEKPMFVFNSAAAATLGSVKTYAHVPLHSYLASKALANFFILRLQYEHPKLIVFAVHPGAVATERRTVTAEKVGVPVEGLTVDQSVSSMLSVFDNATLTVTSGTFVNLDGVPIPW